MLSDKVVDVSGFVESRRMGAGQWWLLVLCLTVVTFDGFDAQIMGYTAPSLMKSLHVSSAVLGPVISSGLFGLMLGALVLGTLGDRLGRKTIILIAAAVFGVGSLLTSLTTNVDQMTVLRFITGIGLGGAMPGAIALVSEYMPPKLRGTMVTITVCGFAIGPAIGGFVAAALIHKHGWASLFVVGGAVPLLMLPVLWWKLPESSRFLIGRGDSSAKVVHNLRKVFHDEPFSIDARYTHAEGKLPKAPVREVFAEGRALGTVLLWLAIFLNLIGINLQTSWLPLMITGLGYPITQAVTATAMLHVGGAIGGLALSHLLDRFDPLRAATVIGVLAGIAIILVGFSGGSLSMLKLTIFLAGLFVVGAQCLLNALSGMFYPSHIRSTGSGWALGMGRFGAAVGPMVGSALAALHLGMNALYYIEAIPFFLMATAIFMISFTRSQKTYAANRAAALMHTPLAQK